MSTAARLVTMHLPHGGSVRVGHPLLVGTQVVTLLGDGDTDPRGRSRRVAPRTAGTVADVLAVERRPDGSMAHRYGISFPQGTRILLEEEEVGDPAQYRVVDQLSPCICDNCRASHPIQALRPVVDRAERVDQDGEEPAGECPLCGCLSYRL